MSKLLIRSSALTVMFFLALHVSGQNGITIRAGMFKGPYNKLTLHAPEFVYAQPQIMLHNFHDGGMPQDVAQPQVDFKKETEEMLNYVMGNIESRIQSLNAANSTLAGLISRQLPSVEKNATQLNQRSRKLNATLMPLAQKPELVLDVQKQAALRQYLESIHSLKNASHQELSKVLHKQQLVKNAIDDLHKIREKLISESTWHTSDAALLTGILATNIMATSNLIYDLLAINPAAANNAGIYTLTRAKEVVQEALVLGEFDIGKMRDAFIIAAVKDAATEGNDLLKIADAIVNLAATVKSMTELPEDQAALKEEIRRQLENVEREINKFGEKNNKAQNVLELHRYIIQSIDNYLKLNNINEDFRLKPIEHTMPPLENIRPRGFEFQGIDFREELYQGIVPIKADINHEGRKIASTYETVRHRFNEHTERGTDDPVFKSMEELLESQRTATMCSMYAERIANDIESIKQKYPAVDKSLIESWVWASQEVRYTALNYYPFSDKTFRFTPVQLEDMRKEITNAVSYMQQQEVIPQYACNIYTAYVASKVYNVNEALFKKETGEWLTANELAAKASVDNNFHYIGNAYNQGNLDKASYYATIGKPVIALYYNSTGHGHVNMVLPGLNAGPALRSGTWKMWVPLVTNYSLTESGPCTDCFLEGKMSDAFSASRAEHVILYWLSN